MRAYARVFHAQAWEGLVGGEGDGGGANPSGGSRGWAILVPMRKAVVLALALLSTERSHAAGDETELPRTLQLVEVKATSTRAGKSLDSYAAWKVLDGNAATVWCEGKPDAGAAEGLTITFAEPVRVDSLSLVTGVPATPELFEAHNVPDAVTVTTDDGRTLEGLDGSLVEGAFDHTGTVTVEVGPPAVRKLTVGFGAVQKIAPGNHTCIADVRIASGGDDVEPIVGLDRLALKALPAALQGLLDGFKTCDRVKIADRTQFPLAFDFLQPVAPSPANGFTQGVRSARASWRAAVDLTARCAAGDPAAPSVAADAEVDGIVYSARSAGPGELLFRVDTREGEQDTWRLAWKDRRWKLTAISRIPE